jgi:serine/threonine-protein kinase
VAEAPAIAVLPFANLSSDPENEYFSDGLTEELIHALTKIEGLRVVAWSSAFQFKGKARDIREIGRQLNVATVLEGSVRRAGDALRISAQLIRVSDGQYLWSQIYSRQVQDIFAIQDEISRAIAGALRIQLVGELVKPYTASLDAYNSYLRGRFCWNKRTEEGVRKAIEYFSQAIAIDPQYAPAWSGLADSHSLLGKYGLAPAREALPLAKAAAAKALEIDDTLAEAHTSFAYVRSLYEWQWAEAEQHYGRAIELNPGYANAHHWYGVDFLIPLGRLEEARAEIELAQQLDPLSLIICFSVGFRYMAARDYDRAIEEYRRALDLDPNFYKTYMGLGRVYLQKGMHSEAIGMIQKGQSLSGGALYTSGLLGECFALSGRRVEAQELLGELIALSSRRYVPATTIALIYIGLGEIDRAFEWLDKACENREPPVTHLRMHPAYDRLRSDSRFAALLERVGLAGPASIDTR